MGAKPRRAQGQRRASENGGDDLVRELKEQLDLLLADSEIPQGASQFELEEIRDNLWDLYLQGGIEESLGPDDDSSRYRRLYNQMFADALAAPLAASFSDQVRRDLVHALRRIRKFAKLDLKSHHPTVEQLAMIKEVSLPCIPGVVAPARFLTSLEDLYLTDRADIKCDSNALALELFRALDVGNLRRLALRVRSSAELLHALAGMRVENLEVLTLIAPPVDAVCALLAQTPKLRSLGILVSSFDDTAGAALARSLPLSLESLYVADGTLDAEKLAHEASHLPNLKIELA